jgi:hypothetical protein
MIWPTLCTWLYYKQRWLLITLYLTEHRRILQTNAWYNLYDKMHVHQTLKSSVLLYSMLWYALYLVRPLSMYSMLWYALLTLSGLNDSLVVQLSGVYE